MLEPEGHGIQIVLTELKSSSVETVNLHIDQDVAEGHCDFPPGVFAAGDCAWERTEGTSAGRILESY